MFKGVQHDKYSDKYISEHEPFKNVAMTP